MAIALRLPYTHTGGQHPEAATLAHVLAAYGLTAPHTGQPLSEALLVGLGGLGAGYILWEFKHAAAPGGVSRVVVLAFHAHWQYPERYVGGLLQRLGLRYYFQQTGSARAAADHLAAALAAEQPPILWVDLSGLPYRLPSQSLDGHAGHVIAAYGVDSAGNVLIDDRAGVPLRLSAADLAAARARIGSFKHRLLTIEPAPTLPDLAPAIDEAIAATVAHLSAKSGSFALPAFQKWARLLTDRRNAKGWPNVFAGGQGLFGILRDGVFKPLAGVGPDGGSLRDLYADFLDEASVVTGRAALSEAAAHYRRLAVQWQALAEAALPDMAPAFAETKRLLRQNHQLYMEHGMERLPERQALLARLGAIKQECEATFPLSADDRDALLADLQARLQAICAAEAEGLRLLKEAL